MLLAHARDHDAKALRVLGRRVLDVVAPEIGEQHEARVLEAEEQAARASASFTMVEDGHGPHADRPVLHDRPPCTRTPWLAASLDTGDDLSAGEARRLACRAAIIPAVLDGASQVLDLGRKRRFHTEPQRIALAHRDRGCTALGCDAPPGLCHAHHDQPWSRGGNTDTTNPVAHGKLEFIRRT